LIEDIFALRMLADARGLLVGRFAVALRMLADARRLLVGRLVDARRLLEDCLSVLFVGSLGLPVSIH
jgi:hypothetical protein